jgi:DNA-binding response OmpR family regulator/AraC-like DNA-binding protein
MSGNPNNWNVSGQRISRARLPTILWIDDQADADCMGILSQEGFCMECAETGEAGLRMSRSCVHDAIILDLRLPDIHGLTVLERLRGGSILTPVIVMTGYYMEAESEIYARAAGATMFVYKPVLAHDLCAILRGMLAAPPSSTGLGRPTTLRADDCCDTLPNPLGDAGSLSARSHVALRCVDSNSRSVTHELRIGAGRSIVTNLTRERIIAILMATLGELALSIKSFLHCAGTLRCALTAPREAPPTELILAVRQLTERSSDSHFSPRHESVVAALELLERAPYRWSEGELANRVGVSRAHFGRLVHADTGLHYRELRRAVVLKAAVSQILMTDEQIAQISNQLGFSHPAQLDREFRELFGCCPRELRNIWKAHGGSSLVEPLVPH